MAHTAIHPIIDVGSAEWADMRLKRGNEWLLFLSENALTIALFHQPERKFIALQQYTSVNNLTALCKQVKDNLLHDVSEDTTIRIALQTPYYTVVPDSLYEESSRQQLLSFTISDLPAHVPVFSNLLVKQQARIVFAVPEIYKESLSVFPNALLYAHVVPLAASIPLHFASLKSTFLLLQIHEQAFDLVFFKGTQLLLLNTYTWQTPEDVLYFTLFTMEQLGLDSHELPVFICGTLQRKSALYDLIYTYVKDIRFTERATNLTYSHVLADLPAHAHYTLFNLPLCE